MSLGIASLIDRASLNTHEGCRGLLFSIALISMWPQGLAGQIAAAPAATTLPGRVVNARTGAAMGRVLVQVNGQARFTSAEGRFQILVTSDSTSVQFTKPGFSSSPEQRDPETLTLDPAALPASLDVELWPEAVLTGSLTTAEGDPLPHLTVSADRLLFQNGLRQMSFVRSTTTDAHGGFRMPVPAGDYVLHTQYAPPDSTRSLAVMPTGRPMRTASDATGTIHIASGQELHFDLHPALAAAFGVTIPLEGSSSQRYTSLALTTSEGVTFQASQRVNPDGMVLNLPAGTYQLSARLVSPQGQLFGHQVLTVPERESTSAPLHLEAVSSLPLVVTVDPASPTSTDGSSQTAPDGSSLNLELEPDSASALEGNEKTIRSNGRGGGSSFAVPPGTYRLASGENAGWSLQSASFGGVDLLRNPLVVGSSAGSEPIRVVVTRGSGSISGVTRLGGVAARCWIVVVPEAGTLPRFFVRHSSSGGQFTLSNLPLRSFRLLALPLLPSADFGEATVIDQFQTYVQTVSVTSSSTAPLALDAVPVHELYP